MANRILSNEGIFDYLGNVSARNPVNHDRFFISRALAPDQVTKADIQEVALDGRVRTKAVRMSIPSCTPIPPMPVLWPIPVRSSPVIHQATIFFEGVLVYNEYDFTSSGATGFLVTTQAEGDRIAPVLGSKRALLMVAHGCVVVGDSVPSAVHAAITLRDNIVVQLGSEQAGNPKYMTETQSKLMIPLLINSHEPSLELLREQGEESRSRYAIVIEPLFE